MSFRKMLFHLHRKLHPAHIYFLDAMHAEALAREDTDDNILRFEYQTTTCSRRFSPDVVEMP